MLRIPILKGASPYQDCGGNQIVEGTFIEEFFPFFEYGITIVQVVHTRKMKIARVIISKLLSNAYCYDLSLETSHIIMCACI